MSGHSKWASIKHKKGAADAKRGAAFSKMAKELTVIAKNGGGDPDTNATLRTAIDRAKGINMPKDKIDNAIKKGTGEIPGVTYEEISFDAYGPGGVAMMITGLTDNNNRTTAEIKAILKRKNGSSAGAGATSFMFSKTGYISVEKDKISEEEIMEIALEAGAEDIKSEGDFHEITTDISNLQTVRDAIAAKDIPIVTAEMTMTPSTLVKLQGNEAKQLLALVEALEEHEDVQNVYANFDISDAEMERIAAEEG
ncbi:MAG: YebC/PmpR family DNA-binding transcriptional regulator [Candidatus Omnitrophica bacterium]|nr:YebC/PmpR family DNA-binding transcriptional regulator [Candidatus Omnitrophota bacterium]